MSPHFDPEGALLVEIARKQVSTSDDDRIHSLFDNQLDWDYLLSLARGNGMRPILLHGLQESNPERVPDRVLTRLENVQEQVARRNLFMAHELSSLLDQLENHDVPALPFKGPTQAQLVFDAIGMREFNDLDILVSEDELDDAIDVLRANDYRVKEEFDIGQHVLIHQPTSLPVDLHYSIFPIQYPFSLPFERLWARRTNVQIAGNETVWTLDPSDMLLLVAVHSTKHSWFRLEWLLSFTLLANSIETDIQRILSEAKRIGCYRMLLLGFALSERVFRNAPPEQVAQAISTDSAVQRIADQITQSTLFHNIDYSTDFEFHRHRYNRQLILMPDLQSMIKYGLRIRGSYLANELARFEQTTRFDPRRFLVQPIRRIYSMYTRLLDRS